MKKLALLLLIFLPLVAHGRYVVDQSDNELVNRFIAPYTGKSVSAATLDNLVREISQSGLFQLVYAERGKGNRVSIQVQESEKLQELSFTGSQYFTEQRLREKSGLKEGGPTSTLEIKQAVERLTELYKTAGYYDSRVTYSKTPVKGGLKVEFFFEEGPPTTIEKIEVISKNQRLNKELRNQLLSFVNLPYKRFTSTEIEKEVEAYLIQQRLLTAKISDFVTRFNPEKTKVKISVSISDPTIYEFIFYGNKSFTHFDLIKQSKIGGKFLYLSDSSSELADNIRNFYKRQGFAKVKVEFEEEFFPDIDKKIIILRIDEGPRIRLGNIAVVGKISKPRAFYVEMVEEYLASVSRNIYFVREEIDNAVENMVIKLKNNGYLVAEHIATSVTIDEHNRAHIEIQMDEGILTYIRQVIFRGARAFNNAELKEQVNLEANSPLVLKLIEESFPKLEDFYRNQGYLEFKIKNRDANVIKYNPGQPFADIVYQVNEGPRITVKDILVKGNSKTKEYVIRRELDFAKGDILTQPNINRSIDLLEKTGIFSEVRINSLEKGSTNGQRTILVEVSERDPGLFVAGGGVNNELDIQPRGYVGVSYSNLGGKARGLSARLDLQYSLKREVSYLANRLAVGYYEPYLLEDRIRGRMSLVREEMVLSITKQPQNSNVSDIVEILSRNDINFITEKEISKRWRLNFKVWGFSNQTVFNRGNRSDSKTINIATTGPTVEFDYRNDPFLPTSGFYSRWDFEYSDPLFGSSRSNPNEFDFNQQNAKEVNYFKTTLGTDFYVPLTRTRRWVWANSVRGGYLKNVSSRNVSGVPALKSFFLGGASTIRGFQNNTERIPSVKELCFVQKLSECRLTEFFVPQESRYFLVKTEIRFPLTDSLGGVLFYDGGGVYYSGIELQDAYRDSVGTGVRFETPVGAFVIEVGFKLDRKTESNDNYNVESPFAVHFSLGNF